MAQRPRSVPRSTVERDAARNAARLIQSVGAQLRTAREDAGLSLSAVATAAGLSKSSLHDIEAGRCQPRWATMWRVGAVLGLRLSVGLLPGTGPAIRDHIQSPMIGELIALAHMRWRRTPEVAVYRPVRGVIDLALVATEEPTVACEAQSQLRRIEQQIRWSKAKAEALAMARGAEGEDGGQAARPVSRLLLLRSTVRTRAVVAEYAELIAAAYPARAVDAYAALTGEARWPGDALLWCRVENGQATILPRPPRGITVGG